MTKHLILLLSLAFLSIHQGNAQREASNWYFGRNAGLQFNGDGTVIPLTDGQLDTNEGCATISDRFGNLLFYTDGITVWDRTHNIMTKGTGLLGDPSSSQSAIIVPKPEDPDIYYIFTVHALGGDNHNTSELQGLNFYTVDMSIGANGAVVGRGNNDQPLIIPNSEKITAVRSADCSSIWVISHFLDSFYAYNVSATGVNTSPVISATATTVPLGGYRFNAIGYLKASPNGRRLAVAHSTVSNTVDRRAAGKFLVYDFDASTGIVSNEQELDTDNGSPYGVEFSPNNNLVYCTVSIFSDDSSVSNLYQFDLTAADISQSRVTLFSGASGALQLAPNGRIYHSNAGNASLNVINNPNVPGTGAGFVENAQDLASRISVFGLPPFIQSLFNEVVDITDQPTADGGINTDVVICQSTSFTFSAPLEAGASYSWFFDNGNTEILLPSTTNEYVLSDAQLSDEGIYRVEIDRNDGSCPAEGFGFVSVNPLPPASPSVLFQCDVDSADSTDGIAAFNLEQAYDDITSATPGLNLEFFESNADLLADNPITNPVGYRNTTPNQLIEVRVTDTNGCQSITQLELRAIPTAAGLPAVGPFFACDIDPEDAVLEGSFDLDAIENDNYPPALDITFYTSLNDASLELNPVSGTDFVTENTTLFVRIENNNQCQEIQQIQLMVDPSPLISFPEQINFCLNQSPPSVFGPFGFDIYRWFRRNPGGTDTLVFEGTDFTIPAPGEYRLEAVSVFNDFGITRMCSSSVNFTAVASNIATIRDVEIRDISSNNTITVLVEGEGDYEYALNDITGPYQDSNVFENLAPGFATVYVRDKNGCGISEQEVSIVGFPKFFTPNGDGVNESWQLLGVDQQFQPNSIIFIFDRFGKLVKQLRPGGEGWNGTFNGRPLPASDYWFRAILEDGRDFTGHFTLKR
ncbi:T9SS type B sorting domain-containing protein [Leptobacterium flavescens]|uniref:T9SS type B sorting domain-containing protein n=1 Tax=Leptobacterium flavescens TaxID=472055 RepID=A0A6P0USH9_9FLAO|nr:T9SS type B sorting domain-containing protein [Leptobacterium flavescens]NER15502.1 T9SS type B sorting domain-containing protein [Leptobacterium flavescens]